MTKKIGNLLLGLLWLMTITLATTFWMNTKYGFNIFSAAHWAYLSEMQAYRTQIKIDFYISLIAAIIIALTGFYFLLRPKLQTFFIEPSQMPPLPNQVDSPNILHHHETDTQQAEQTNNTMSRPEIRPMMTRPASPMATSNNRQRPANIAPVSAPRLNTQAQKTSESPHIIEISNTMENAGYVVKPCARIGKLIKPVVALSYDQTVWVCSENIPTTDMKDALQALIAIFDDTLGDSANDLTVHGCIVNTSEESSDPNLISTFNTLDEFQEFMNAHQNNKPDDYDAELFDAISTYISTVTNYIGKQ